MKFTKVILLAAIALVMAETVQDARSAPPPVCPPICDKK